MDIRVGSPAERPPDCAYCREPAGDDAAVCPACASVLHADCARELGGACATLGCPRAAETPRLAAEKAPTEASAPARRVRWGRWLARLALVALLAFFAVRKADRLRLATLSPAERRAEVARLEAEGAALMRAGYSGDRTKFHEARAVFERLAEVDLSDRRRYALEQVGHAQEALDDPDGAFATYTRIIDEHPGRILGHYWRAHLRLRRGDVTGALADFEAAIAAPDFDMPRDAVDDRWLGRARCRAALGDLRGAVEDYTTFIGRFATPEALEGRARARAGLGDVEGAAADLAACLQGLLRTDQARLHAELERRRVEDPAAPLVRSLERAFEQVPDAVPRPPAPEAAAEAR